MDIEPHFAGRQIRAVINLIAVVIDVGPGLGGGSATTRFHNRSRWRRGGRVCRPTGAAGGNAG